MGRVANEKIIGKKYGRLTVLKRVENDKKGNAQWLCECDCGVGNTKIISTLNLNRGTGTSCGKCSSMNLKGVRFGRLTVLEQGSTKSRWVCKCDCGNICEVREHNLITQNNRSCGCLRFKQNEYIFYSEYVVIIASNTKRHFFIDKEDFEKIKKYRWYEDGSGYLISYKRETDETCNVRLHRIIMDAKRECVVDHIDRNPLNNRKSNLRICTKQQNSFNQSIRKESKSGIIGVCWNEANKNWRAYITLSYKRKNLGSYQNKKDAITARLKAEIECFGIEFAPQRHLFDFYKIKRN